MRCRRGTLHVHAAPPIIRPISLHASDRAAGRGGDRRPSFSAAKRSETSISSSRSWLMTMTRRALGRQVHAAPAGSAPPPAASTPQVGWLTTSTSGRCRISRPMTNFCRLPPDSARAARARAGRAHVERLDDPLGKVARGAASAGSRGASGPRAPTPVSSAFSVRRHVRRGGVAEPFLGGGEQAQPAARAGPSVADVAARRAGPRRARPRISPDSAASSSSWPLPATPPMPSTSPRAHRRARRPCSDVPNGVGRRAPTVPSSSSTTSPGSAASRVGHVQRAADHHLGQFARPCFRAGRRCPTTLPQPQDRGARRRARGSLRACG